MLAADVALPFVFCRKGLSAVGEAEGANEGAFSGSGVAGAAGYGGDGVAAGVVGADWAGAGGGKVERAGLGAEGFAGLDFLRGWWDARGGPVVILDVEIGVGVIWVIAVVVAVVRGAGTAVIDVHWVDAKASMLVICWFGPCWRDGLAGVARAAAAAVVEVVLLVGAPVPGGRVGAGLVAVAGYALGADDGGDIIGVVGVESAVCAARITVGWLAGGMLGWMTGRQAGALRDQYRFRIAEIPIQRAADAVCSGAILSGVFEAVDCALGGTCSSINVWIEATWGRAGAVGHGKAGEAVGPVGGGRERGTVG